MASRAQQCSHHPRYRPIRAHSDRAIATRRYYSYSSTNVLRFGGELDPTTPQDVLIVVNGPLPALAKTSTGQANRNVSGSGSGSGGWSCSCSDDDEVGRET